MQTKPNTITCNKHDREGLKVVRTKHSYKFIKLAKIQKKNKKQIQTKQIHKICSKIMKMKMKNKTQKQTQS